MTLTVNIVGKASEKTSGVALVVDGKAVTGWTDIEVTRSIEGVPNHFNVALSAIDPKTKIAPLIAAGKPCEVRIDDETIITGYINRDINEGDANGHRLRVIGRGKCQDLVDCSAEWPGGNINGANVREVANQLALSYGIAVIAEDVDDLGPPIQPFALTYGTPCMDLISRMCSQAGLLAYEGTDGNLLLARVGTEQAGSGVEYGKNVERWHVTNSMDQRYSEVVAELVSTAPFLELGDEGYQVAKESDPNVERHRLLYIVAESVQNGAELVKKRALWEVARRCGRGTFVQVTVDSWRDKKGKLWTPNTLVPVDVPGLRLEDKLLCLAEVTYRLDSRNGTTADMILMPPSAFSVEPTVFQPVEFIEAVGAEAPASPPQ